VHSRRDRADQAPELAAILRVIYYNMREGLCAVPHVSISPFGAKTDHPPLTEFGPASQEVRVFRRKPQSSVLQR